jgi:hypothetical protein
MIEVHASSLKLSQVMAKINTAKAVTHENNSRKVCFIYLHTIRTDEQKGCL